MWGQPAGMRTAGFDRATDLGGKWVMPGIYGYGEERGGAGDRYATENLLGYGLPEFMLNTTDAAGNPIYPERGAGQED